ETDRLSPWATVMSPLTGFSKCRCRFQSAERNPDFERNPKSKTRHLRDGFGFSHSGFFRISPFGFRILATHSDSATQCLARRGDQRCRGVRGRVIEVDFFNEADGELIVGEPDVLGGVDARSAMLAHPPKGE